MKDVTFSRFFTRRNVHALEMSNTLTLPYSVSDARISTQTSPWLYLLVFVYLPKDFTLETHAHILFADSKDQGILFWLPSR